MTAAPRRIVSLVPSATETVCALGAGDRLVGCTRYCEQPVAVTAMLPKVGGTKNPQREAIVALAPDLVLGNAEENRGEDLDWLAARVPVLVQTPCTVLAARDGVRELGERLGCAVRARELTAAIDAALADCAPPAGPPLRAFYAIWPKPWMGVGRGTYIADVLARLGIEPVGGDTIGTRYPTTTPADVIAAGAELVLLPSEPWIFTARERDELRAARTFGDAALLLCDGRDFCWHGARTADGLRRAATLLTTRRAAMREGC